MTARLIRPDVRGHASFLAAMAEFAGEGRTGDDSMIGDDLAEWGPRWDDPAAFATYVDVVTAAEHTPQRAFHVTCTNLWWVEGPDECPAYVGRISIRHRLTPKLREIGGHIGYDVRRSRRREGQATAMLTATLPVARDLGIDPALITCDADNLGSRAVIERNGGVLDDEWSGKLRFWVPTN